VLLVVLPVLVLLLTAVPLVGFAVVLAVVVLVVVLLLAVVAVPGLTLAGAVCGLAAGFVVLV